MKKTILGLLLAASAVSYAQPVPPLSWYLAPDQHLPLYNNRVSNSQASNNDAAAGIALLGLGLGIFAAHEANERREQAIREREAAEEAYRRRIESSPMSTVQRTYIPQCFMRQGYDQYGRLYYERVCL